MQCPKCGYERKESDVAPAWQCPNCGIAVEKYNQLMEENDQHLIDYRRDAKRREEVRQKQYKAFYFLIPITFFGLIAQRWGNAAIALMFFLFGGWALYAAYIMQTTGYFFAKNDRVISKDEEPIGFKLYILICILGAVYLIGLGIRCLLWDTC